MRLTTDAATGLPTPSLSEAKAALLCAAERLYVEQGPAVSLKDIAHEAGQRNNSAVNYHFGSREGVEVAALLHRAGAMEQVRAARLEGLGQDATLRDLVRVLVEPTVQVPRAQGATHYSRFVEVIRFRPSFAERFDDPSVWPATRRVTGRIARQLDQLDGPGARRRLRSMSTTIFALAADHEHDEQQAGRALPCDELVEVVTGLLRG
ncbi:MAG: hypothetical protein ACI379_05705 [Nocardioides sp.]|uniref:TetR/AcrR family transcriptional regulator n=1 Tax=Nocardioides sp. TaxID=35761 RepID=UPI003F0AE280